MFDHVTIGVTSLPRSLAFYDQALAPLGLTRLFTRPDSFAGYGTGQKPAFWVTARTTPQTQVHIAFTAPDRPAVAAFHAACLAAGGTNHGAPGPRLIYHPNYYGAFILDPDGHNIEAVCHLAP